MRMRNNYVTHEKIYRVGLRGGIHSTMPITKKKHAEILLCYRQLYVKGDIIMGEWDIFGV